MLCFDLQMYYGAVMVLASTTKGAQGLMHNEPITEEEEPESEWQHYEIKGLEKPQKGVVLKTFDSMMKDIFD